MKVKVLALGLLCFFIFAYCKKGIENPHSNNPSELLGSPIITYFNAVPMEIFRGQSSTLSWSVQNATTVSIDQGIGVVSAMGTTEINPVETTTYTLTAKNSVGQKTCSRTIKVKEPAADLEIINVGEGMAWNIIIYCLSSGYTNPSDWQMFMFMKIKNTGNRTATDITLHLQIFDRWWEEPGAILVWEGMTLFTNYNNSLITLGPNGQTSGWFRWTNLSIDTLETLYLFLKSYSGSTPVHFWLTWE